MKIQLQVLGAQLRAVAEEMGAVLIRSAFSANIKERRDCSTALFDEQGRMIVQAEHIPVHLGAMPEAVAAVLARDPQPGEVYVVNDPFTGGTHLPDITLVSRVPCGLACSRAHHADVGGMEPASLPAGSTDIYQEGLVLPPVRLDDELLTVLLANMRNPDERRGDLNAQLAAHRLAEHRLAELVERRGADTVTAAMDELYRYSERVVRAAIARLPDGRYEARDVLEPLEGSLEIKVAVTIAGDEIEIDFAGTSPQHEGNLNCPLAVTRSACYFVVRCLTEPDLPSSGGAYAPVHVTAPTGSLVNASSPAAVVAGNTETSSRIVDVVFSRFRPGRAGSRAGPGHDEQRHVRQSRLHLLRDGRRRTGWLPGRGRAERGARRHVEHAQHSGRGARAVVPAARGALRVAPGLRRRRCPPRRRRRRSRATRARGLPRVAADASAADTHRQVEKAARTEPAAAIS